MTGPRSASGEPSARRDGRLPNLHSKIVAKHSGSLYYERPCEVLSSLCNFRKLQREFFATLDLMVYYVYTVRCGTLWCTLSSACLSHTFICSVQGQAATHAPPVSLRRGHAVTGAGTHQRGHILHVLLWDAGTLPGCRSALGDDSGAAAVRTCLLSIPTLKIRRCHCAFQ